MIYARAAQEPEGLALDDLIRRRTWSELEARCHKTARLLRDELGLTADDHVAILMGNRVEYVELVMGALLAGLWLTPINRHLNPEEIRYIVQNSGARVLFADADHAELARATGAPRVLLAGEMLEGALAPLSSAPVSLEGPAGGTMIYTSGTTGRPRGVKRARAPSAAAALQAARAAGRAIGLDGSGPHLITGPLYHAAPLLFALYDQLGGAPVVIMPRWDAGQALELIEQRSIRHTHLVPTMFVRLLDLPESERRAFDPTHLRTVLHGAAPISPHVKQRMIDWWGPVLVEYWGATEGGVNTLCDSHQWLAHPGTVGTALPRFEIYAVGEDGERLPPGAVGTLHCRHRELARVFEYHDAPEKTAEAHPQPHVFCIGDVGRVDADGCVYLSDRLSHMIISGGVNIYPAEIEQALLEHPAVADIGVFGIPNDEWGETVKAAIELAPGTSSSAQLEAEILAFAREHLAGYKVPRSIDFHAELPRQPNGKLYIHRLRDPYWEERARKI